MAASRRSRRDAPGRAYARHVALRAGAPAERSGFLPARWDPRRAEVALLLVAGAAVCAALGLSTATALWLDEAQSVAIARLRPDRLLEALRQDGAPPAYYLLLHAWMKVAGSGDLAVRALSGLLAIPVIPLTYRAARRILGPPAALPAAVVALSSPFFLRYATEARMYSLVLLLVALGAVLGQAAATAPRRRPGLLLGVSAVSGTLLLTHYWTAFLVGTAVVGLAASGWRRRDPRLVELATAATIGTLLFFPWVPSLLFQLRRTGAPWGATPDLSSFELILRAFAGHTGRLSALGFAYAVVALVGMFGVAASDRRFELDLRLPHGPALGLLGASALPVTIGIAVSAAAGSAFAPRYAAIAFVPFTVLVARGVTILRPARAASVGLALIVLLGAARSAESVPAHRTQAPALAAAISRAAQPGDVLALCPDQLGPALARELPAPPTTITFAAPAGGGSLDRVNWIDYGTRMRSGDPEGFAEEALTLAGPAGSVWLVMGTGYRTLGESCTRVAAALLQARPAGVRAVKADPHSFERAALWRYPPPNTEE